MQVSTLVHKRKSDQESLIQPGLERNQRGACQQLFWNLGLRLLSFTNQLLIPISCSLSLSQFCCKQSPVRRAPEYTRADREKPLMEGSASFIMHHHHHLRELGPIFWPSIRSSARDSAIRAVKGTVAIKDIVDN